MLRHVLQRAIVLPEQRILFLPLPGAGGAPVLRVLAELAGLDEDGLARHRLGGYSEDARERLLGENGWLRFSLARDPATRLWSAWQSEELLREPGRLPGTPAELIAEFRRFVATLSGDGAAQEVHWAVQCELLEQFGLTHVGTLERLDETMAVLRDHLPAGVRLPEVPDLQPSPLPYTPGVYDAPSAAVLRSFYARDYERFGYAPPSPPPAREMEEWEARIAPALTALRLEQRLQSAERALAALGAERDGAARTPAIVNREGETAFNVRWAWSDAPVTPGITGVLRVKDEARALPWVLPSLLRAVSRVLLLDNGSTDGTPEIAREIAAAHGAADRLEVRSYPYSIARCGAEHLGTPADSLHSLTYFYNWSFSQVRTAYALKWDGDMVLADGAVTALQDLAWQLEAADAIIRVPRYPLYVMDERRAFVDTGMSNCEPWGWPNRPGYSFVKAMEWELPVWGSSATTVILPDWSCFELKFLDADEFGHWSQTDFSASARTERKNREIATFQALADGGEPPEGVVPVVAPEDVHVIEYVRTGGARPAFSGAPA